MKKDNPMEDTMRDEYTLADVKNLVRGKHYEEYQRHIQAKGNATLEPDIRAAFPTDEAVNAALRSLIQSGAVKVAPAPERDAEPVTR
ncbi:MAG: hypothetical protein H7Y38_11440 [Armatimonadetes bacterium]|nr:hypothetical protein [Armatimonadota bacterium]